MATQYDLRPPPPFVGADPMYPTHYPYPDPTVTGRRLTPAHTSTGHPSHRMAPGTHAYHGPAHQYLPAAAPASYDRHRPALPPPAPVPAYHAQHPPPLSDPYALQDPYFQQSTYAHPPIPHAGYVPSPPTPAIGYIPSPPRDGYGYEHTSAPYIPSPINPAYNYAPTPAVHRVSRSPYREPIPPLSYDDMPPLVASHVPPPQMYTPRTLVTPSTQPRSEPVTPIHPSRPGTANAAFWPPSPPPTMTPATAHASTPATTATAYTPLPATRAPSRSRRRSHSGIPTPSSSYQEHASLLPLSMPLGYPAFGTSTPGAISAHSSYIGTPAAMGAGVAMGGHMTAAQILQAEVGYPAPGSNIWAGSQGVNWPPSSEEVRRLKAQGVVQSGEIVLAPWLVPNPNDVNNPALRWDVASEPTTSAMRLTSRGTLVRARSAGEIWDGPVARGVSESGRGKIGRVAVQVVNGGNRDDCIVDEFDVGADNGGEVTIGRLLETLHEWARSPVDSAEIHAIRANEPARYDRICAHYHARVQQERGGTGVDRLRYSGEVLRVCDALEGRRSWWGAWVHHAGVDGTGRGTLWVLRVGLADV
ncbi:unnamed protein product [Peniophora sp. CBMAI 1063]|nr:unnamed protein product [Peniophora sp. CBMAI 1063]